MPRLKNEHREQIQSKTRLALLEAATRSFANDGYAGAKVDEISSKAGYAKGTIYNYFASKRELMLAVIASISSDHYHYTSGQVMQTSHPVGRLESFFKAGFNWVEDNPAQARVLITSLNGSDSEFKEAMYIAYRPMFQLLQAEVLAPGVQAGFFRSMELEPTTRLLMATYLGTCSQVDESGKPWIDPGHVAEFALHALRAPANPS